MKNVLKWISIIISWLTLSPLILYLGHRWKIGNKYTRTAGMLLSPLFLMLYFLICAFLFVEGDHEYFQNRDRIERITGVMLPKFDVIEYSEGQRSFTGDFEDSFVFEFKSTPPDEMFNEIDKMVETGETSWTRKGKEYTFNHTWGNGFPAPKGEDDNEDRFFSITIQRGEKRGEVRHGMW